MVNERIMAGEEEAARPFDRLTMPLHAQLLATSGFPAEVPRPGFPSRSWVGAFEYMCSHPAMFAEWLTQRIGVDEALLKAQELNNLEVFKILAPLAHPDTQSTALKIAARDGDVDAVGSLITIGAPITNDDFGTIQYAGGNAVVVRMLLDAGAEVQPRYVRGAIRKGHTEVVTIMLDTDAGKEYIKDQDHSFLITAVTRDHIDLVRLLLGAGVDVHEQDDRALRHACRTGNIDVVRLLLGANANVNANEGEALDAAVVQGHIEVVRLLLGAGVNVHANEELALRHACTDGNIEIVRLLLGAGADLHAKNDDALLSAVVDSNMEMMRLLLDNGADPLANNGEALDDAVMSGHVEVARLLLESGARVTGQTEMSLAHCTHRRSEMQRLLEEFGA